jgi:hypothetical protein
MKEAVPSEQMKEAVTCTLNSNNDTKQTMHIVVVREVDETA